MGLDNQVAPIATDQTVQKNTTDQKKEPPTERGALSQRLEEYQGILLLPQVNKEAVPAAAPVQQMKKGREQLRERFEVQAEVLKAAVELLDKK